MREWAKSWADRHPFGCGIIVGFMLDEMAGNVRPVVEMGLQLWLG